MQKLKMHVKKGDNVVILAGKDKGKKGKVLQVAPDKGRVIVERINVVKKHSKPNNKVRQGGIVDMEAPIAVSNVMLVCGKCGQPTRIGKKVLENGAKNRICKKCGADID